MPHSSGPTLSALAASITHASVATAGTLSSSVLDVYKRQIALCAAASAQAQAQTQSQTQAGMVAAANPLAAAAGLDALKRGGSVVDAAIAVQMVLTVVEPQSSGLGGGSLMLVWDQGSATPVSYTHLDVYKRQALRTRLRRTVSNA